MSRSLALFVGVLGLALASTGCSAGGDSSGGSLLPDPNGTVDASVGNRSDAGFIFQPDGSLSNDGGGLCTPRTCADAGANCGPIGDGCGGTIDCGTCTAPETCGGGGVASQCGGGNTCVATTCAKEGKNCGPMADGCGKLLDCGTCSVTGETCGGGGVSNVCGTPTTDPNNCPALTTCTKEGKNCGQIGNGCGGLIDCSPATGDPCPPGTTCGGGGVPNVCGKPTCQPLTCASVPQDECGVFPDGCGGLLQNCGVTCTAPESCGGGGVPNKCGQGGTTCVPLTQTQACTTGKCGPISDGCGGVVDCGGCTGTDFCGGGGVPSQCGSPVCVPRKCADVGANCGQLEDGCGAILDCGSSCSGSDTCGGGGTPNQCGSPTCKPLTCADQGINCGQAGDGCGGILSCGTCTSPNTCGGGGTPSVCGAPACTPLTCADVGAQCGPVADGCGGLTANCGTCTPPAICGGGGVPSMCGGGTTTTDAGPTCTGLCQNQVTCTAGSETRVTGKVYAPNGTEPLYNAVVYVPNAPLPPIADGASCDRCENQDLGSPLVSTITGSDGSFTLKNVPAGVSFPLVVKMGKWRRSVTIPAVTACAEKPLGVDDTRLPRNQGEGHLPKIAMSTGDVDELECVLRKMGVSDSEFTPASGSGRVHLYRANGVWPTQTAATYSNNNCATRCPGWFCPAACNGLSVNLSDYDDDRFLESQAKIDGYDMVIFGCEGGETNHNAYDPAVLAYVNKGGRVFASHYSYTWLYDNSPLSTTATWGGPTGTGGLANPTVGTLDTTFPKGVAFSDWIEAVGASHPTLGQGYISISDPRAYVQAVNSSVAQDWIYTTPAEGRASIQHYTFNTPVGAAADQVCGRVVYSAFHVANANNNNQDYFPHECATGPLTAQEKVLEFMLFDLAACVSDDTKPPPPPPTCTPKTCTSVGAKCGFIADGCGGSVDCGTCTAPESCGGGGTPNQCGNNCSLRTCGDANANCGYVADGCGGVIDCGVCNAPAVCGGGGTPNVCGTPSCIPRSCSSIGATCGKISDGCGNIIDCGTCSSGTCGGGGTPNVCGSGSCSPLTCASQNANCGAIGDGCGGTVQCGTCVAPQTCGGGGVPNQCGGTQCVKQTCQAAGATCGPIGDGCGGVIDCGDCTPPQICGGGGTPSQCGGSCTARTCTQANATCGQIGDGCGGILSCGTCPAGQTCGGGGVANQCGSGNSCTPKTCAAANANCGFIGDGCGGVVDCGTCTAPATCGGSGTPNQCGTGTGGCLPKTCSQQNANCGPVADGCGGLLDCGVCTLPETCGGGGTASRCGGGIQ